MTKDKVVTFLWAVSTEAQSKGTDKRCVRIDTTVACLSIGLSLDELKRLLVAANRAKWQDGPTYYSGALTWSASADWSEAWVVVSDWALESHMRLTVALGRAAEAVTACYNEAYGKEADQ